jgi:hypothetical protein
LYFHRIKFDLYLKYFVLKAQSNEICCKSCRAGKPRLFSLEDEEAVDYFEWWAKHRKPIAKNGKKGYATNAFEWEKFCLD